MILALTKKTRRLIIYTLVLGGSFYLGIIFYSLYGIGFDKEINIQSIKEFRPRLELASKNTFKLRAEDATYLVKSPELKQWIEPYTRNYSGQDDLRLSSAKITDYLESLDPRLSIDPINAKFTFKNNRADVFIPSADGKKLNIPQSVALISSSILTNKSSVSLAFDIIAPAITLEKINNLGIKTLIGRGESDYGRSTSARIHNITIGMSKFNGVMLAPNEEFSFNKILGDVDEASGYQAELVIKNGQLVKEFGGGLCQVATTVFRSAILSGLDIIERKPHSFPVQYYNPQGFDATIYPGIVDLRFKNNTPGHILIQTRLIGSKLVVEIYGSKENTEVKMEGPVQYDIKSSGAMKAYFIRKIYTDGKVIDEERFDSTYNPPPPHERNPLE